MTQALTKTYASMLANDDSAKLMAALPVGADPREYALQGDLLPSRCAMYGAIECLMALLESRPDLAADILAMPDSAGERVIDWCSAWARPAHVQRLRELAPEASSSGTPQGHWPLLRALAAARWDSAEAWLDAAPAAAKQPSSQISRGPLFLLAEPSAFFLARSKPSEWPTPPRSLADALLDRGASPLDVLMKGSTPLGRAAAAGNRPLFDALAARMPPAGQASSPEQLLAQGALLRGAAIFGPAHEAIMRDDDQMLAVLIGLGWPVGELTAKSFLPLHVAVRHDARRCAELLLASGSPSDDTSSPTSCGSSAMASPDPIFWLDFLKSRGASLDRRDDHGAHFAELAWERLGFEQARSLWASLGSEAPLRATNSFFGSLERAARSDIEPQAKLAHLLSSGALPARIAPCALPMGAFAQTLSESLSARPRNRISGTSFGVYRSIDLGPAWFTEAEPASSLAAPPAPAPLLPGESGPEAQFQWDSDFSGKPGAPYPRPSLLAYCAVNAKLESLRFLISWDRAAGHWSDADYLCAWRDAIRDDAPLPILREIFASLRERSIDPWPAEESCQALATLGPTKRAELGAPVFSDSAAVAAAIAAESSSSRSGQRELASLFFLGRASPAFRELPSSLCSVASQPWTLAAASPHLGAIKSIASDHGAPWGAASALRCAMALAAAGRSSGVLWIASILPQRAQNAPSGSPWALAAPSEALRLWQDQLVWEACRAFGCADPSGLRAGDQANLSGLLLPALLNAGLECVAAATALVSKGIVAPRSFQPLAAAISEKTDEATAIGAPELALQALRSFCQAICARPDFVALLNDNVDPPILAGCPDPAIFDAFLGAGASLATSGESSISRLCARHASRITPGFAARLAKLDRGVAGAAPLGVASLLAEMRPHHSRDYFDLAHTSASVGRVLRAAAGVELDGWIASLRSGSCPIAAALGAHNVHMALELARIAPEGYLASARAPWMGLWLKSRSSVLARALRPMGHDAAAASAEALATIVAELGRLQALGASLGQDPAIEAEAFLALATKHMSDASTSALTWLLERGERPSCLIEVNPDEISYAFRRRLGELFPQEPHGAATLVPAAGLCLAALSSRADNEDALALCRAWQAARLPASFSHGSSSSSIFSLLPPTIFAAYEAEELSREPAPAPATKRAARL